MKEFYTYATNAPSSLGKRNSIDKDKMTGNIAGNLGQILLTYNQIEWTQNVKGALTQYSPEAAQGANNPLKKLRNIYKKKIETYIQVVEQRSDKLSDKDRKKTETMIIMEEHNRDVIDKLFGNKSINIDHFEWRSQLRYEREGDTGNEQMLISCWQLDFTRDYGYEY